MHGRDLVVVFDFETVVGSTVLLTLHRMKKKKANNNTTKKIISTMMMICNSKTNDTTRCVFGIGSS